jgi:hypothetical protein
MAPLVDGVYEVDVVQHIEPVDADTILGGLERRSEAMKMTNEFSRYRKRSLAIDDLDEFVLALESGEESAFDVAVYLHVHGPTRKGVVQDAKRIAKRVRRSGARTCSLPWEQKAAIQAVAPLAVNSLERRVKRVDTSSVKRLYPWTASSMWMEDAVPLGETLESARPVGLNVWRRPLIPNPHEVLYMLSGGGKGFMYKVQSSRELFAGLVDEFFTFDQAEEDEAQGEYGKWSAYCGIEYRHVRDRGEFAAALADLDDYGWIGPGITWNIARLALADRPEFLSLVKEKLWKRAAALPARRKWGIDELWSFVKLSEQMGVDPYWLARCVGAIEDLVRTGRHMQVGAVLMTQCAKDSLDVPVMQVIQSLCAIQVYGMQNPSEISDIAGRLQWTPADIKAIKKFSPGQMILSAGPWRVAMRLTASDAEYAMANTDGRPSRAETAPSE